MSGDAFVERVVGGVGEALDELALLVGEFVEGAEVWGLAARAGVGRVEVFGLGVHVSASAE
jgi:hypothetical protein